MHTNQPTDLDQDETASQTDGEQEASPPEPIQTSQVDTPVEETNGAASTDDETEALAALWTMTEEIVTAQLTVEDATVEVSPDESEPPAAEVESGSIGAADETDSESPLAPDDSIASVLDAESALPSTPQDSIGTATDAESGLLAASVDSPVTAPSETAEAGEPLGVESVVEPVPHETAAAVEAIVESTDDDVLIDEVIANELSESSTDQVAASSAESSAPATSIANADACAEDAATSAANGTTPDQLAETVTAPEKVEPVHVHDEATDKKLIEEVEAAPHKVYLLNRVKKAISAAGESERAAHLKAIEEQILGEIGTRTAAKEALCERAEALKESTAWKVTGDAFKALFDEWKQVGAAGRELDDQLWARFNLARGAFNEHRSKHFEEREVVWSANRELKEALEAEALSDSTAWKATADAIRDLQARWKAVGSAGREKDEALWARFNTSKQKFFDHRTAAWEENRKRKEALVIDAETLKDSADWRTAGDAMKAMQTEWKNVGPAGREHEDELWSRFRAATQTFFDRRSSVFAERNQAERDNAAAKIELCVRAEGLLYAGDVLSAAREAKDLQAQWKEIGPVPREQSESLWARFREACDKIFANASGERDRQQNEWHVRMREAMTRKREQLSSLRESIAHDEANIERWRESLSSLKPGGKSEEIGKSLEDKIIDVMNRIREKQERAEDLKSSITDIEAKLKE